MAHYIARFHYSGDDARLLGLLPDAANSCFASDNWRLRVGDGFNSALEPFFPLLPTPLAFAAILRGCFYDLLGCLRQFALCQGLGWFNRLAAIGHPRGHACDWPLEHWTVIGKPDCRSLGCSASAFYAAVESGKSAGLAERPCREKREPVSPWTLPEFVQFLTSRRCGFFCGQLLFSEPGRFAGRRKSPSFLAGFR